MSDKTKIEWTDATWNPVRGCSLVSAGCTNCYAMHVASRFSGPGQPYAGLTVKTSQGPKWNGEIMLVPDALTQPIRWKRPRKIFVNSMSDLFHENVPDDYIDQVFAAMALAPQHVFQVLTKRPERMLAYLSAPQRAEAVGFAEADLYEQVGALPAGTYHGPTHRHEAWPLANVWIGVSVENQAAADERVPLLLNTPAAVRWVSMEPLLGTVNIRPWLQQKMFGPGMLNGAAFINSHPKNRLDWVVVGGESGPKARPMHPDWTRNLLEQCAAAGVPFLFKQWGEWAPRGPESMGYPIIEDVLCIRLTDAGQNGQDLATEGGNPVWMQRAGKKTAGRLLDGALYNGYPTETP